MSRSRALTVIGIDPGIASTGFGVIRSQGAKLEALGGGLIATDNDTRLELRLAEITAQMRELIDRYDPDEIAIEEIYFGRNVQTAFAVGQARGAVLAVAGADRLACHAYTPQAIKLAVCGSGSADKQQVQRMVGSLLGLGGAPESDHVADALAVAICHAQAAPARIAREAAA